VNYIRNFRSRLKEDAVPDNYKNQAINANRTIFSGVSSAREAGRCLNLTWSYLLEYKGYLVNTFKNVHTDCEDEVISV